MTTIAIEGDQWLIDSEITYPDTRCAGLLMNARMVNCTFEDTHRADFDPDANTARLLEMIPQYRDCGVRAFTLCLQGGMPGYEGAVNSAYNRDGSLRADYMARIGRVVDACDAQGIAVILSCYYQRQDQILHDAVAIRAGVVNAVEWIGERGYAHVVLEVANEFGHRGFTHELLKTNDGQCELVQLAKETCAELLVSTVGQAPGAESDRLESLVDFNMVHLNTTPLEHVVSKILPLKKYGKPVICNEDDKLGEEGARCAELCVDNGVSWGLMQNSVNQTYPFGFDGWADDPVIYDRLKELTTIQ